MYPPDVLRGRHGLSFRLEAHDTQIGSCRLPTLEGTHTPLDAVHRPSTRVLHRPPEDKEAYPIASAEANDARSTVDQDIFGN